MATTADGIVIGCGGWSRERPGTEVAEPGTGHVRHVATHPGWIGHGIARLICETAADQALRCGITRLEAYAGLNAIGFYRALGFVAIGPMVYLLPGGAAYPSVHMTRALHTDHPRRAS